MRDAFTPNAEGREKARGRGGGVPVPDAADTAGRIRAAAVFGEIFSTKRRTRSPRTATAVESRSRVKPRDRIGDYLRARKQFMNG